ncbi:hypothetical protein [Patulibacter sp. SYSU D01012]|uniref:hypothetical protein n=1 Tax=Patulibacter sp. SYSU D01012 TaxID=2817381 RepID=UPI001B307810|nr:hypothetical protein [Patulibacter sp. SYSU D01012]
MGGICEEPGSARRQAWGTAGRVGASLVTSAVCLAGLAGLGAVSAQARGGEWAALAPTDALETGGSSSGATVDDGQVNWLLQRRAGVFPFETTGFDVRTVPLAGGRERRVTLDVGALERPQPAGGVDVDVVNPAARWHDGRVVVVGQWALPAADPTTNARGLESGFRAVFDAGSGRLLSQQRVPALGVSPVSGGRLAEAFVPGTAPVLRAETVQGGAIVDGLDGGPLGASPAVAETSGASALVFDGPLEGAKPRWARGVGAAHVVDLRTGAERYRVTARALTTAAGVGRSSRPQLALAPDGGLSVTVASRRARTLHAVAVDASGRVRRVSRPLRRATAVAGMVLGERSIVGATLEGAGARGREQDRLWLADARGRRGVRLSFGRQRHGLVRSTFAPFWWDGRTAAWDAETKRGRPGIVVTRTRGQRLTARAAPSGL